MSQSGHRKLYRVSDCHRFNSEVGTGEETWGPRKDLWRETYTLFVSFVVRCYLKKKERGWKSFDEDEG